MILRDSNMQVLICDLCDERQPVTRSIAANPEMMAIRAEDMALDHRECDKYPGDMPRAKRERRSRKRMERASRMFDKLRSSVR